MSAVPTLSRTTSCVSTAPVDAPITSSISSSTTTTTSNTAPPADSTDKFEAMVDSYSSSMECVGLVAKEVTADDKKTPVGPKAPVSDPEAPPAPKKRKLEFTLHGDVEHDLSPHNLCGVMDLIKKSAEEAEDLPQYVMNSLEWAHALMKKTVNDNETKKVLKAMTQEE